MKSMDPTSTDILIDRIAANEAGSSDFAAFEGLARAEPAAWEGLARALRDELQMRSALNEALSPAERQDDEGLASMPLPPRGATDRGWSVGSWSGWALAAAITLAWVTSFAFVPAAPSRPAALARDIDDSPELSAEDALDRYLALLHGEGRLVAELPSLMVESHPRADGELDVYFVRRFLERETVASVYELGTDEHGQVTPVRVSPASYATGSSL
jgi:hypothetical protein